MQEKYSTVVMLLPWQLLLVGICKAEESSNRNVKKHLSDFGKGNVSQSISSKSAMIRTYSRRSANRGTGGRAVQSPVFAINIFKVLFTPHLVRLKQTQVLLW